MTDKPVPPPVVGPRRRSKFWLGQLRHAYKQVLDGHVRDHVSLARYLLGPAIEDAERYVTETDAALDAASRALEAAEQRGYQRGVEAAAKVAEHRQRITFALMHMSSSDARAQATLQACRDIEVGIRALTRSTPSSGAAPTTRGDADE